MFFWGYRLRQSRHSEVCPASLRQRERLIDVGLSPLQRRHASMRALAKRELMAPQPEHWTYNTSTGWSIIANDEGRLSKSEETEKTKTVLVGTHHESKSRWDRAYNWHEWFTQSAEEKRYKNEKYYKQNAGSCRTNAKNFREISYMYIFWQVIDFFQAFTRTK